MTDPDTRRAARAALRDARERISDPAQWCGYAQAVTAQGAYVAYDDPMAVRWSAGGSLYASVEAAHDETSDGMLSKRSYDVADAALVAAVRLLYPSYRFVEQVNKDLGHAAVLRCYAHAIKGLEGEDTTHD